MSKGQETRSAILDAAIDEAAVVGVSALSIGNLATRTGMSKSGLFGHFGSKESLQLAVLEKLVERFTQVVIVPALQVKNGVDRLRAISENYMNWVTEISKSNGCPVMSIAFELDSQPGPLLDYIAQKIDERVHVTKRMAQKCVDENDFRSDLDIEEFAFTFEGIMLAFLSYNAVLKNGRAKDLTRASLENLIRSAQTTPDRSI